MTERPRQVRYAPGSAAWAAVIAVAVTAGGAAAQTIPGLAPDAPVPDFDEVRDAELPPVLDTLQRSNTAITIDRLSTRIEQRLRPRPDIAEPETESAAAAPRRRAGQATGGGLGIDGVFGVWASGTAVLLDSDGAGRDFDGESFAPRLGVDFTTPSRWAFGAQIGADVTDLDTDFNDGTLESTGFVVSGVVGHAIGDNLILDGGLGYVALDYDRTRDFGALTSSFNSDRIFGFVNAVGFAPTEWHGVERLQLSARAGFRYAREEIDSFREGGSVIDPGEVETGQITLGAEARYFVDAAPLDTLELFGRAVAGIEVIQTDAAAVEGAAEPSDDRTDLSLSVGAVAGVTDRLSADLTLGTLVLREDFSEYSVSLGLRYSF